MIHPALHKKKSPQIRELLRNPSAFLNTERIITIKAELIEYLRYQLLTLILLSAGCHKRFKEIFYFRRQSLILRGDPVIASLDVLRNHC